MTNEYKYALLKAIQERATDAILKDLDNKLTYTGHSLVIRSIQQVQHDNTIYILDEVDRGSKLRLLL